MKKLEEVVKIYCQALLDNDYSDMIDLFAKNARISSYLAGDKSPFDFYQDLFANSRRTKVDLKNLFFDSKDKKILVAYIRIEAVWKEQFLIEFEAIDMFEFDKKNKVKSLKIILDTYPIKVLRSRLQKK